MTKEMDFEIPKEMRDMAERNLEQARAAHTQFMDVAHQAQTMMAQTQAAGTSSALEVQRKAIAYAEQNMNESFDFASQLARTPDMQSAMKLQQDFAQRQLQSYTAQAQELSGIVMQAAQSMKPKT